MSKATEQRVKQKLKNISKEFNTPFNALLDTLFLERFLVRIGKSDHKDILVFKGGMCLAQFLNLNRETKDIDFLLTQLKNGLDDVKDIMEEISSIDAGDDFIFSQVEIEELSLKHKKYPGYRISVQGNLEQIKHKVSIDIGVGDVVRPRSLEVKLMKSNGPLFEESIDLNSYPPEYIFSEKLEAILYLGDANSRMKDFYDCHQMIQENVLDLSQLKTALKETFEYRETKLELIPAKTDPFVPRWNSFLKKNKISKLELDFVIDGINKVIAPIIGHSE